MRTDRNVAGLYLLAFPIAAVLAVMVPNAVLRQFSRLIDGPSYWWGVGINLLLPATIGGWLYSGVAYWARGTHQRSQSRHVVRTLPLYLVVLLVLAVYWRGFSEPGFVLISQLYVWSGAAAIGGILADYVVWRRRDDAPAV